MIYNLEDGRKALRDVFALQLFDNVQVRLIALAICWTRGALDVFALHLFDSVLGISDHTR